VVNRTMQAKQVKLQRQKRMRRAYLDPYKLRKQVRVPNREYIQEAKARVEGNRWEEEADWYYKAMKAFGVGGFERLMKIDVAWSEQYTRKIKQFREQMNAALLFGAEPERYVKLLHLPDVFRDLLYFDTDGLYWIVHVDYKRQCFQSSIKYPGRDRAIHAWRTQTLRWYKEIDACSLSAPDA
jgi:hypothetical protein